MDISYCDIKKNLRKISEIAKESDTSLENVLLYLIRQNFHETVTKELIEFEYKL